MTSVVSASPPSSGLPPFALFFYRCHPFYSLLGLILDPDQDCIALFRDHRNWNCTQRRKTTTRRHTMNCAPLAAPTNELGIFTKRTRALTLQYLRTEVPITFLPSAHRDTFDHIAIFDNNLGMFTSPSYFNSLYQHFILTIILNHVFVFSR